MKIYLLFTFFMLSAVFSFGQRYLTEVFADYSVSTDLVYGSNISVLSGTPATETLVMDVYEPVGDMETSRPVILVAHDGEYLPEQTNGLTYGNYRDSAVVELCAQFARRGFVAVAYEYRLGWNPSASTQDARVSTYFNAFYRGVQDGFTVARYLRMDAATQGNTYKIDPNKIVSGGMGTGGQISIAMAFLDKYQEINLPKFLNPATATSYVDTSLSGDFYGTLTRPLNTANHTGYISEIQMAFNLGGLVGDSTWIEAGDVPVVSMGVVNDPYTPYDFGALITPVSGDFMYNISGEKGIQRRQYIYGNNGAFSSITFTDPYTQQADVMNGGMDGLYPFNRPGPESAPWMWWDQATWNIAHPAGGTYNDYGMLTNPDMSKAKALLYLDTVVNYLSPRIVCGLGLAECSGATIAEIDHTSVQLYPNPVENLLHITVPNISLGNISILNTCGEEVLQVRAVQSDNTIIDLSSVSSGIYFVHVTTDQVSYTEKIVVQ